MADTINIEGMNEKMARTDSLVAKLAQDVDKLAESYKNLSKSANIENMLGTINNAFKTMGSEITNTSNNVKQGVSSIIDDITKLVQTAGKTRGGIGKGVKLDFVEGTNITEHQELFNAAILKAAENYETLRGKVTQLKKDLLALYADTPESERRGKDYLNKRKEITQEIALLEKEMTKDKDAYLAVLRKDLEVENLIKQANDKEKKDIQELSNLYKQLKDVSQKRATVFSKTTIKGWEGTTDQEVNLMRSYARQIDELENKISVLAKKYPELAEKMRASFNISMLEQSIRLREKEAAAAEKATVAAEKKAESERKAEEKERFQQRIDTIKSLENSYKEILSIQEKISQLNARKQTGPFSQEEKNLLEKYTADLARLQERIELITNQYPALSDAVKESFSTKFLEQEIKNREKQRDAVERVTNEIDKQIEKENKLAGERAQRLLYEKRTSVGGALDYSANVKNEIQAKQAIEYLTAARKKLDNTDANYNATVKRLNAEIQRHQQFLRNAAGETTRLQTRTFSLLQSTKQLAEGFGIMFSVYGISNFIRKLVQVTGEFEIQQTALKSIINSADKAQTMFGELQKMAVASPYSIQQLVSYNKQLAAYRVETDKLLPVLKQLGDVASGVGVDMQRLILAYGQVKAANYLRGQELRQFSEAGINILGELARRFSDAEGKVVSTGEVFDRVSKRLVKFEDVAAVFDDLTKKGGIFYDMQAKQAQTVRGQLMNLKDAFQIALYEIGQETNGSIKTFLRLLRGVAQNLTTITKLGASALVLFIAWKTNLAIAAMHAKGLKGYIASLEAGSALKRVSDLFAAIKGNPIAAAASVAATAVLYFVTQIVKARKRMNELKKESIETFSGITENLKDFRDLIQESGDYKVLSDGGKTTFKLVKTDNLKNDLRLTKSFIEDLEKQGIELKPGFNLDYSEKDKDKLAEQLADFMNDAQGRAANLISAFEGGKKIVAKFADPVEQTLKWFTKDIDELKEAIRLGGLGIENELVTAGKKLKLPDSEINQAVDAIKRLQAGEYSSITEAYELWNVVKDLQDKITEKTKKRLEYEKESNQITLYFGKLVKGIFGQIGEINSEFAILLEQFSKFKGVSVEQMLGLMADPQKGRALVNEFLQYTKGAFQESGKQYTDDIWNQQLIWLREAQKLKPFIIEPLMKGPYKNQAQKEFADWQIKYNKWADAANERLKKINKDLKVDKVEESEVATTQEEQIKTLSGIYDDLADKIKIYKNEDKSLKEIHKQAYKEALAEQKEVDDLRRKLGYTDKKSTKSAKDRSSEFEKMVKFIRQLRSEYDKLNKTFSSGESFERVANAFKDEFAAMPEYFREVFGDDIKNIEFMTPEQVVKSLDKIEPIIKSKFATWQQKLQIYFEKNKAEEQVEVDVKIKKQSADEINRQIEELFSNYEIQMQLTDLGITSNEAKDIFNLDAIDLNVLGTKLADFHDIIMEQFGEDEINKYKEFEKRFTDIYEKSQMERLKKYAKFLQIEMSERVKVEMETLKQLAELESTPALYGAEGTEQAKQRERIRQRIKEERDKKVDSLIWKEFQQTDLYIELFNDLGNASNKMLLQMYEKLEKMKGSLKGLSAQELKAIEQQMENLRNQIVERNPFDAAIKAAKDFKELKEELSKDETLKKVLGVDEIGNFRKTMKQGIKEIGDALYNFYVDQENNGEVYEKGLYEQLHIVEELYQAAQERDRAASELMKMDINFGEEWFDPKASLKAAKDAVSLKERQIALAKDPTEIDQLKTEQIYWQLVVDELNKYIAAMNTLGVKSGESTEKLGDRFDKIKKTIEEFEKVYGKLTDAQKQLLLNLSDTSEAIKTTAQTLDSVQDVYETWMENLDYLGGATDELTEAQAKLGSAIFKSLKDVMNLTSKILDTIPNIATAFSAAGTAINASMGIIGLIAEALQLVITLVKAIGQFHDDNISASISTIQRKVDLLTRSYEDLSEAFESAFDANRLREFNRLMINNLQQQRDFLEQEIALEEDKKKTDRDYVNSLKNELDDIDKKLAETSSKLYEELGGFGSDSAYKSAAEQFVDAWYNAFMETGSGLSGLEDTFDEFFVKMIKKQLMQKLADRYFKDMLAEFDELLNRGDIWENDYFWNNYMNDLPGRIAEADEAMQELFSRLQGLFGAGGIGGLGDLQRGIQGVTEQTADILATYLNSIRLYVAQDNQNMTALINWLGVGTTNDSLMSNIRLTAQNTAAINTLLQSLVPGQAHTLGGAGLKVFVS